MRFAEDKLTGKVVKFHQEHLICFRASKTHWQRDQNSLYPYTQWKEFWRDGHLLPDLVSYSMLSLKMFSSCRIWAINAKWEDIIGLRIVWLKDISWRTKQHGIFWQLSSRLHSVHRFSPSKQRILIFCSDFWRHELSILFLQLVPFVYSISLWGVRAYIQLVLKNIPKLH
jgi:hypothetical protein